jgi:hypothetical protein
MPPEPTTDRYGVGFSTLYFVTVTSLSMVIVEIQPKSPC